MLTRNCPSFCARE